MQKTVKTFPVQTQRFSAKEKRVFDLLALAAAEIAPLYEEQKNTSYNGANFYPADVSRQEIEEAAEKNPDILSPYTFTKKDPQGGLFTVPYYVEFHSKLKKIAQILKRAAVITQDEALAEYLMRRADDLFMDNYDESNIAWLQTENSKIGFVIGAFDRYHDRLFFKKRSFMAWLGILDEQQTREMDEFRRKVFPPGKGSLIEGKVVRIPQSRIRIEDTAVFSGLAGDFCFVGNELPSSDDLHMLKEHGTLFTVFKPPFHERFRKWILPSFYNLFSSSLRYCYSENELRLAFLRATTLHEAYRSQTRYEDASSRLQEFFPLFDEIYPDALALQESSFLLTKGSFSDREVEALIAVEIAQSLYFFHAMAQQPYLHSYAMGHALFNDFLLRGGALIKKKDGLCIDFHKMLFAVEEFSNLLNYYLAVGTRQEAQEFFGSIAFQKILGMFSVSENRTRKRNLTNTEA